MFPDSQIHIRHRDRPDGLRSAFAVYHLGSAPHSGHYKALGRLGASAVSEVIHDPIGNQGAPTGAADPALYIIDDGRGYQSHVPGST